jgi:hypothetical protein
MAVRMGVARLCSQPAKPPILGFCALCSPRRKGAVGGITRSGYRSRATQHHGPSAQEQVPRSHANAENPTTELLVEGLTALTEALRGSLLDTGGGVDVLSQELADGLRMARGLDDAHDLARLGRATQSTGWRQC